MVEGEKIRALCLKTVRPFRVFCGCINPLDGSNGATSLNWFICNISSSSTVWLEFTVNAGIAFR